MPAPRPFRLILFGNTCRLQAHPVLDKTEDLQAVHNGLSLVDQMSHSKEDRLENVHLALNLFLNKLDSQWIGSFSIMRETQTSSA